MSAASILHLLLHFFVPGVAAWLLFRRRWRRAWIIMLATMIIDADHLLATPVYDPNRCSIGFHPLHKPAAIAAYGAMTLWAPTRIVGSGLLIHMALDASDCAAQRGVFNPWR